MKPSPSLCNVFILQWSSGIVYNGNRNSNRHQYPLLVFTCEPVKLLYQISCSSVVYQLFCKASRQDKLYNLLLHLCSLTFLIKKNPKNCSHGKTLTMEIKGHCTSRHLNNFNSSSKHLNAHSGHSRCTWVCFFMGTNLEKCSFTSLAHQWMLCSEWVPSEWESKQLI